MARRAQPIINNKEDASFREALKLYESKQHKKSLKLCEQVLKKNSHYGEALALKAMLLHHLKEPKESELYVSKALAVTTTSPVSNHILGILRRTQLKYDEAAKYFKAALDNGSTNKQIWKDLSTMEMQSRDYSALVHSRLKYLDEFLGYRANWSSLAVAHHLKGDFDAAERTLTKFEELAKGKLGEAEMYEHSELLMYKNEIIAAQDVTRALEDLNHLQTFDKCAQLELKARYLMELERPQEAQRVYRELLKRNPDNVAYYYQLEKSLGTTTKSEKFRDGLYAKLRNFYPRSDPPRFIPLTFTTGDLFKERVKEYVLEQLKRGVPAAFTNVKPLYKDKLKVQAVQEIVEEFYPTSQDVSPLCWVWTTYFLAQHYLHVGQLRKARELVELAVKHTPTLVELYILKARIYKHLGDVSQAAQIMNEGRLLDLQDRFINSKCVKYYLRANELEKAIETVSLFTKNDNAENGLKDVHMMQVSWFIIENAESYARLYTDNVEDSVLAHKYAGLALKRFYAIVKIFEEYWNDQVDFHTFCMRKGTARAYIDMVKWEDQIFNSPVYCRAVSGAFKLYNDLIKSIKVEEEENNAPIKNDKKAKKEKAARIKALQSEKTKLAAYAEDEDVFGETLIGRLDTFEEKFFHRQDLETLSLNEVQFQLQFQKNKMAPCLVALTKLMKLSSDTYPLIPTHVFQLKYGTEGKDAITKMLATKGVEKHFTVDWEQPEAFIDKYCVRDSLGGVQGLVALYRLQLPQLDNDKLKQEILEAAKNLDPFDQHVVMSSL
jgi:peptide alpha-N-acetyltransferase